MSRPTQVVCDGCGKTKQECNHWWQIVLTPQDEGTAFQLQLFSGIDLEPPVEEGDSIHDFCGQDCALKFISEQMGKVNG